MLKAHHVRQAVKAAAKAQYAEDHLRALYRKANDAALRVSELVEALEKAQAAYTKAHNEAVQYTAYRAKLSKDTTTSGDEK